MGKIKDLKGLKFGRLTAIEIVGKSHRSSIWKCKCDCGRYIDVAINRLMNGETNSCGCLQKEFYKNELNKQIKKYQVDGTNIAYLQSKKLSKLNKSGVRGVSQKKNGKWLAQITFRRKTYNLGTYDKKEEAIQARKNAEEKFHKKFLREKGLID